MRQFDTTSPQATQLRAQVGSATEHQHHMARGLVHAIILSLAMWVSAAYLIFILR